MSPLGRAALRALLLLAGLALIAYVVSSLDRATVAAALRGAAPFMPLVVAAELGIIATDVMAARTLLGTRAAMVRRRTWIRSTSLAYALGVVLPAGRAAGEAARAATLQGDVGLDAAAAAGARLQTASLFGTAAVSLAGAAAALGTSGVLASALAANAALCGALGAGLLSLVRWRRLTTWLRARLGREALASTDTPRGALPRAIAWCSLGRCLQALQYGIVLGAVGGAIGLREALLAQGVHIVGASVGDAIPSQLGVTEGAYRVFAQALGLGGAPARAVSIALCVRIAQLGLAGIGWGVATITARDG